MRRDRHADFDVIHSLVTNGDIDLEEYRKNYADYHGRPTILDDDDLINFIAEFEKEDPVTPSVRARIMVDIEAGKAIT